MRAWPCKSKRFGRPLLQARLGRCEAKDAPAARAFDSRRQTDGHCAQSRDHRKIRRQDRRSVVRAAAMAVLRELQKRPAATSFADTLARGMFRSNAIVTIGILLLRSEPACAFDPFTCSTCRTRADQQQLDTLIMLR